MTSSDTELGLTGLDTGTARLNVPLLLAALAPQVAVLFGLLAVVPVEGAAAVVVAVGGVLAIAVYRQYATRVAAKPGYERSDLLHRLMGFAIVTSLVLLVLVVVPFAVDRATGACACV